MVVHLSLLLLFQFSYSLDSSLSLNSSVNPYQTWYTSLNNSTKDWFYDDGSSFWPILFGSTNKYTSTAFFFGFFANTSTTKGRKYSFYLVIGLPRVVPTGESPDVVWCANRDNALRENATLRFTAKGALELEDVDDGKDNVIWQSFDNPTDTWLPNQKIYYHKGLTSSNSSSIFGTGFYSLIVGPNNSLVAFINSDPPQSYMSLHRGTNDFFDNDSSMEGLSNYALFTVNRTSNRFRYIRLEANGYLFGFKLANYDVSNSSTIVYNLGLKNLTRNCDYPTACGNYGVCSDYDLCSCPGDRQLHAFLELKNVTYFNLETPKSTMDIESCKRVCLDNCTCKAAFFSSGQRSLKYQLYSLKYDGKYNSVAFIKVQNQATPSRNRTPDKKKPYLIPILASTLSVGFVFILVISSYYYKKLTSSNINNEEEGDERVIGALKRFSFLELKSATRDFQVRLG
ncbi:hypothetical protein LguiB_002827 [Lonicera macranthoides]